MKVRLMNLLAGAVASTIILFTAFQAAAAAPAGELTIVSPLIGNQIPIPWEEMGQAVEWMKLLYDPMVGTTSDAELSTEAGLSEKWEMSPDGLIWTFYLRKGVKFHDGVEVTAKDVKFTIEKNTTSKVSTAVTFREKIKSMEVKDTYTLVIHCKTPYLLLPDVLLTDIGSTCGSIVPKDYYERVGRDKFFEKPIGSGPYKFHSQQVGSFLKLEATERHWRDGVPRYKYVTFRIIPEENTRIAMLKTGEADIARISRERVKECQDAGLNVTTTKNPPIVVFQPNFQWESPTISDVRMRKALNLAIDREAIIKHVFGGRASPTTTYPGANILGVRGVSNLKPYPYDPQEARRLIREGKFEGVELSVPNIPRAGCPEMSRVVEAVCGYWEKIGVKPKIYNIDFSQFRALRHAKKTVGHLQPTDSNSCRALSQLLQLFRENLFSTMEVTLVKDPKADEMIERAERSLNRAEVEKIVADLYRYTYDNYVFIPICDINDEVATTKRVPNWDPGYRRYDRNFNDIIRQR